MSRGDTGAATGGAPATRSPVDPPRLLAELIAGSGVAFNGPAAADIHVRDPEAYRYILARGALGLGEAYMDGLWDCRQLDVMFTRLLRAGVDARARALPRLHLMLGAAMSQARNRLVNRQTRRRARAAGQYHYDIGNDVFTAMLDPTLSYSCGYWAHARDLDQAQFDKLDMICRKLALQPGERLLDIGCGWGGLAEHAARHYGAEVFGVTVSREQLALARQRCAGLPVRFELMDYRDIDGHFDKIASVGMFEHVGPKNHAVFFRKVARLLARDGLCLLHSIGTDLTNQQPDAWIDRYIFPGGKLPSSSQIASACEPVLVIRDWHEFGADYDRTLMAWWRNFDRAWPTLQARYGPRFYRMWKYYLHVCAGAFRAGSTRLWQIVLSRPDGQTGYRSLRP
jgi:cyclopropane-fatty-acyl-phospholipid synthase